MAAPVFMAAHDHAAAILSAALGFTIARDPTTAPDDLEDRGDGVLMLGSLQSGPPPQQTGFLMGAQIYEFEQHGQLELVALGGDEEARRAALDDALALAVAAIAGDRTLGGRVSFVELAGADFSKSDEGQSRGGYAYACDVVLTYETTNSTG